MDKYKILITYDDGDSFNHYCDEEKCLNCIVDNRYVEFTCSKIETVRENLNRIKEHYTWYLDTKYYGRLHFSKKELKEREEEALNKSWFTGKDSFESKSYLMLVDDNSKEIKGYAFWTGYFATLKSAEIFYIEPERDNLKIEF